MGFFLGMESGGDVKFFSPAGCPRLTSVMRIDEKMRNEAWRGHPGWKILHHRLTPYPERTLYCYPKYFLKISWIFARAKCKARELTAFPLRHLLKSQKWNAILFWKGFCDTNAISNIAAWWWLDLLTPPFAPAHAMQYNGGPGLDLDVAEPYQSLFCIGVWCLPFGEHRSRQVRIHFNEPKYRYLRALL